MHNLIPTTINKIGKSLSCDKKNDLNKPVNNKKIWILIFLIPLVFFILSTLFRQYAKKPIKGFVYDKLIETIQHKHHQSNDYKILFKPIGYNECIIVLDVSSNEFVNKKIGDKVTYNVDKTLIIDTPCENQLISQYNLNEKKYNTLGFLLAFLIELFLLCFFYAIKSYYYYE